MAIVPGVPNAGLSVTLGPDGTSISVDWNAVSGATSYQVQQRIMGGSWSPTPVYSGTALIAQIPGLSAAYYENQVRACKTVGSYTSCSAWSNSTYGRVPGLGSDGAPADSDSYTFSSNTIQYIDFDGIFTLQWSAMTIATYNGPITATYYYVNSVKVTSKSKSYTDQTSGLHTYYVEGCTVTQLQGDTSPKEYCSSTLAIQVLVQEIAPNPATFEAFVPNVCGTPPSIPPSVTVNWEPGGGYYSSSASKRYDLEMSVDGGSWSTWSTNYTSDSKQLTPTADGAAYRFRVKAYYYLNSEYSPKSAWTTSDVYKPECPPAQPAAPTLSQPNPDTATDVNISWNKPNVAVGNILIYHVERRDMNDASPQWQLLGGSCQTGTQTAVINCVDSEAHTRGHVYQYRVQARKSTDAGSSPWSTASSIAIAFAQPSTPLAPIFSNVTPYGYIVSWGGGGNSNTGPVTYKLTEKKGAQDGPWVDKNDATSQGFDGRDPVTVYEYKVRACNTNSPTPLCNDSAASAISFPGIPGAITMSNISNAGRNFTVGWVAAPGNVNSYELMQSTNGGQSWAAVPNQDGVLLSEAVAGAIPGVNYQYKLRACNNLACGVYTDAFTYWVPEIPGGLTAAPDAEASTFRVSWNAIAAAHHYVLEQSTNGTTWESAGETPSPALIINALTNGATYYYRVSSCNELNECSGSGGSLEAYLPYAAPKTPGVLSHNASENNPAAGAFTMHWTAPATINSDIAPISRYLLEYSSNGGSTWQAAPTGGAVPGRINVNNPAPNSAASATLSGLPAGGAYSLRVRACNADACSDNASPYQVYLPRPAPGAPTLVPTVPSTDDQTARRFTVQWTAPATGTVDHYELEASAGLNNGIESWLGVAETPATGYTFTDRDYGQTYRYRVRACSEPQSAAANCSAWVLTGDIRLKYPTPKTPGGIAVSGLDHTTGNYTLNWNGVLGWAPQYRYELQQNTSPAPDNTNWQSLSTTLVDPEHLFTITGYAAGNYRHRIRACNPPPDNDPNIDCSGWSPETTVTLLPTPTAPATLSVDDLDGHSCQFNVGWTPSTGGQGAYHYQVEVQINSGSWTSLAWTTGTSYNLLVHGNDSGDPHVFRVRARTLSNNVYSPWGAWRTGSAVTTSCGYGWSNSQTSVSAPQFNKTGQFSVSMQYIGTWAPGLRIEYEASTNNGNSWSRIGSSNTSSHTATYGSSNARATGYHQHRIGVCDHDIGTGYDPDPNNNCGATINAGGFSTSTVFTTVLRAPSSIGTATISGSPNVIENAYIVSGDQFTLNWTAASSAAPATNKYEIQYKPADQTSPDAWMALAVQTAVGKLITLPELGVAFDYRVRACAYLEEYVNCGGWSQLNYPVKQTMPAPRFPVNTYPADGELVIYDKRVPLQWLPPLNMATTGSGIHHYEISLRSRESSDEDWVGPEVLSTPAPVTGSDSDPPLQQDMVEVEKGGQKEFLIRACGTASSKSCGTALVFAITVVVPPEPPAAPAGLAGQADPDASTGTAFNGALSGEFAVQPSGAATYSLPILVPPGTAGMQPKISLDYSSQGGNGIVGHGWSIGGLSGINRCNKTKAQDGEAHAVDYSANDAYCLDGQRLIEIGTNSYRTEKNDFSRITRMTSGGACGAWFEVKTQVGKTFEYGKTADACILNTQEQAAFQWMLNKVSDLSSNYIAYKYSTTVGSNFLAIDSIEYTGREGSPDTFAAVEFDYENRPDSMNRYQTGIRVSLQQRLATIRTEAGEYRLVYTGDLDPAPGSRLQSVEYCAYGTPNQCMEPLTFTWHTDNPGWSKLPSSWNPPHAFTDPSNSDDLGARLVDLDADGLPDLVYARDGFRMTYRNTGSGWQSWSAATVPSNLKFLGKINIGNEQEPYWVQVDRGLRFADRNGDGKPELLDNSGKTYELTNSGWNEWPGDHEWPYVDGEGHDKGIRFADIDGDWKADLIRGYNSEREIRYGSDGWTQQGASFPGNFVEFFQGDQRTKGSELADINGDGLIDMMRAGFGTYPNPDLNYTVWLNDGYRDWENGEYHLEFFVSTGEYVNHVDPNEPGEIFVGNDIGMRLQDINADGLPDLIRANVQYQYAYLNTGKDWAEPPVHLPDDLQFVHYNGSDNGARFVDINLDGYVDVVNYGKAWLNPAGAVGDAWHRYDNLGLPLNPVQVDYSRLVDINGDGLIDMLSPAGAWSSHTNRYQITGFSDGLGNTTEIKYKALTDKSLGGRSKPIYTRTYSSLDADQKEVMLSMQLVDRVIVNDGIGGKLTTEYAYKGLIVSKDRGMQGFEQVTAYKPDNTVVTTHYETRFPYSGQVSEMEIRYGENGPVLSHSAFEYCYAVTSAQTAGPEAAGFTSVASGASCGTYNDHLRYDESIYVYTRSSTETKNQLSDNLGSIVAAVEIEKANTFGRYGYLTHSTVTTTGDGNTYRTETVHEYNSDVTDAHWKGLVSETTVTETVNGLTDDNSVHTTQYFYTSIGRLQKEVIEPNATSPITQSVAYAYDVFGNRVETTVCEGSVCSADPGIPNASSPGRSTTTIYDAQGRYPITLINALDQTETREYQHPLGLQTKLIGPNGLTTSWAYDPLGRKVSETTPFGTTTTNYRKAVNAGYVLGAKYFVQTNSPASAPSRVYYDGLGRKRRVLGQSMHGEYVAADIEYDRFGRVRHESQPYFVYSTTAGDAYWTEYDYDGLGRAQQTQVPLGDMDDDGVADGMAVSSFHYDGFETRITDAKGRRSLTEVDALGRTVRKVDDLDGKNVSVTYAYDSSDNLVTTTVDGDTATSVSLDYDLRGRKISMDDPDMGHWDYQYNAYGELVWQRDAKLQVTEMTYDKLGRMVERVDDATGAEETSHFVFDTAPGAGIGKLASETGAAGDVKQYSYTARGQVESTEYQINTHGWQQSFVVAQTYDAFGRVQQIHYPEVGGTSQVVENVYSPFGGLWYVLDVSDPADEAVYWIADLVDARGKVIQETLRNQNMINNSTNAATGWLQKVESWDKDLNMIQQTRYAFDAVGNVESRERFRPWIVHPDGSFEAGENEQVIEVFTYDSLDRLLSSTVSRNGVQESSNSYDYDDLGNFIYKDADTTPNQYAYTGCNAGPHAVCAAKGSSFTYDANGNMISSAGAKSRTVEYSAFNKPTQIIENGATVDFVYGADRARVFKQAVKADGSIELTWYVGLGAEGAPFYEQTARIIGGQIKKREHLHFIYAGSHHGGQAFAVHIQEEQEDNNPALPNLILDGGTEYYHRDHLGSVIAITGNKGEVSETRLLSFDPWGKRRNENWSEGGDNQYTPTGVRGNFAYTGHEAVTEVGLIHMNGRVYDPELGVFMSADPTVQMPKFSQSYHRYSYVQNNPLRYNDPSGYSLAKLFQIGLVLAFGPVGGAIAWKASEYIMQRIPPQLANIISNALNIIPGCQMWCSMAFNAVYAMHNGVSDTEILANASRGIIQGVLSMAIVMAAQKVANAVIQPETPVQTEVPADPQGANPFDTARKGGEVAGIEGAPLASDGQSQILSEKTVTLPSEEKVVLTPCPQCPSPGSFKPQESGSVQPALNTDQAKAVFVERPSTPVVDMLGPNGESMEPTFGTSLYQTHTYRVVEGYIESLNNFLIDAGIIKPPPPPPPQPPIGGLRN
ncbi:MAG TPA: fibronectin type III domain-containing protein [Gammaproteobacteria bacterium]|nr:fibronectin type III domain-containing protein [Gammaproteobacteria bacterium]